MRATQVTRLVVAVVMLTLGIARADPPSQRTFRAFGAEQGLGNLTILALTQTSDGLIWVATDDGLYRFDGTHFARIAIADGLPSGEVMSLLADPHGLWVGTANGLVLLDRDHVVVHASAGVPADRINALAAAPDGTVWVATDRGLFSGRTGDFAAVPGAPTGVTGAVYVEPDGTVIAGHGSDLVVGRVAAGWRSPGTAAGFGRDRIDQVARTPDGTVWVRSARVLWACDARAETCRDVSAELPDVSEQGSMLVDHAGTLWVATRQGLAHRVTDARWELLGLDQGLPSPSVMCAFEDREGSLWIASDQLYQLLGRGLWRTYRPEHGLPAETVWTEMRDAHGELWLGTNRGVVHGQGDAWATVPGTEPYTIQAIVEVGDVMYLSGYDEHLLRLDRTTGALTALGPDDSFASKGIRSMVFVDGVLWLATAHAGLLGMTEAAGRVTFHRPEVPAASEHEELATVLRDTHGRVWAAGTGGLDVLDGGRWRRFTSRDGLAATAVAYLVERASGELCVAYAEAYGVTCFRYDGTLAGIHHLTTATGLTSDKVYVLGEDHAGRLYVGQGIGVDLVDGTGVEHFSTASGLVGDDCTARSFYADPSGDIMIGSTRGVSRFAAGHYPGRLAAVAPVVTELSLGGARALAGARPQAPERGVTWLNVHFSTPSYANRTRLVQEIRLLPIEPEWRAVSLDEARYGALPYGDYVFEARASLVPGEPGPTLHVPFAVLPAWWQMLWVRALGGLLALALLAVSIRWRFRVASARASAKFRARSEASFRALIEHSPDAVLLHRDDVVIYVNARAVSFLGFTKPSDLVGRPLSALLRRTESDPASSQRRLMATGELKAVSEARLVRADGSEVVVEISMHPGDFDGRPCIVASARDCSERKALEARLMSADRLASIGTLAAGIAHEINNPLAYLQANLAMIAEEIAVTPLATKPELRLAVADALDGASRVQSIVHGIKTFSRVEDAVVGPIDIHRAIDLALRMTTNQIAVRCRIEKHLEPVPVVIGNESKLGQVLINLLMNAVQAVSAGGPETNVIRVSTHTAGTDRAVIEIEDSGCGMSPDVVRRVFEPFFTTKDVGEGTGLGLSICHGIVEALGGEITARSTEGVGSTFRITLPGVASIAAPAPAIITPAPAVAGPDVPTAATLGRVLIVDDDARLLASIGRMLRRDYQVTLVSSAREARARLRDGERYDVILCDMMMPGETGMDLHATLVREYPEQANAMLFMTGGAFTAASREFLDRPGIRRLEKPFTTRDLKAQVELLLDRAT